MENLVLNAVLRDTGKAVSAQLRKKGMIPAVVYGGKKELSVAVSAREWNSKFKTISESQIVELAVGSDSYRVIIKDYQKDYLKNKMQHIDFFELTKGHEFRTHIPLKFEGVGATPGEKAGGLLDIYVHEVEISCLPKDLPADIEVDLTSLQLGESFRVSELKVPDTIKVITSEETVLAVVELPRTEAEPAPAEEAAPEEAAAVQPESK